jgi:hypothetical protein
MPLERRDKIERVEVKSMDFPVFRAKMESIFFVIYAETLGVRFVSWKDSTVKKRNIPIFKSYVFVNVNYRLFFAFLFVKISIFFQFSVFMNELIDFLF